MGLRAAIESSEHSLDLNTRSWRLATGERRGRLHDGSGTDRYLCHLCATNTAAYGQIPEPSRGTRRHWAQIRRPAAVDTAEMVVLAVRPMLEDTPRSTAAVPALGPTPVGADVGPVRRR